MNATQMFNEVAVRPFDPDNRCPYCHGDATFLFQRPAHGCAQMLESHTHRRCLECEYSWPESPPDALRRCAC
jgi:hypothetical protein